MGLSLFRLYRSGGDIVEPSLAAAPSGGLYVVDAATTGYTLARISAAGAFDWHTTVEYAADVLSQPALASNATHVAVALPYNEASADRLDVTLYDSDGDVVWQTTLPLVVGSKMSDARVAIHSDGDVIVVGNNSAYTRCDLVRLDGTDGSIDWSVNVGPSTGSVTPGFIAFFSDGDIAYLTAVSTTYYLQRLDGTDGSVLWSRALSGMSVSAEIQGLAVDGSDNIYAWGPEVSGTNGEVLPVVKVDSSGTLVWSKRVTAPSSSTHTFAPTNRGMANSSGVYMSANFDYGGSNLPGHLFVPGDGTSSSELTQYTHASADAKCFSGGAPVSALYAAGFMLAPANYEAALLLDAHGAADDDTYGSFTRDTVLFDTVTDSVTLTNTAYTRGAPFAVTASSDITPTTSAGSFSIEAVVADTTYAASSVDPTAAFGSASSSETRNVTGIASAVAFGVPSQAFITTGEVFPASFGLPVLELDSTREATGLVPTLAFGLPWAERGLAPAPHYVTGIPTGAQFGEALMSSAATGVTTGSNDTVFGTPRAGPVGVATGLALGAFGTPALRLLRRATGLASTAAVGVPMISGFGSTEGRSTTRFGTPTAQWAAVLAAAAFSSTAFDTPSALRAAQRTRSGVSRTRFGLAQCERTAP